MAHLVEGGAVGGGGAEARMHGERECEGRRLRELREGRVGEVLKLLGYRGLGAGWRIIVQSCWLGRVMAAGGCRILDLDLPAPVAQIQDCGWQLHALM